MQRGYIYCLVWFPALPTVKSNFNLTNVYRQPPKIPRAFILCPILQQVSIFASSCLWDRGGKVCQPACLPARWLVAFGLRPSSSTETGTRAWLTSSCPTSCPECLIIMSGHMSCLLVQKGIRGTT